MAAAMIKIVFMNVFYVFNETSFKPSDFKLTSKYYLTEGCTIQGTQQFLSPDGTKETGHSGRGAVRITVLEASLDNIFTKLKRFFNPISPSSLSVFLLSR